MINDNEDDELNMEEIKMEIQGESMAKPESFANIQPESLVSV